MKRGRQGEGGGRKWFDGKPENEVLTKLQLVWSLDGSDSEAAFYADISIASLSRYLASHPKVAERKQLLRQKPILKARMALANAIDAGDGNLALKYLERKRKQEFSTLQEVVSDVCIENDPDMENIKDDIAGINKSIDREIEEIKKIQESISKKHSHY